jgi:hypothetical protein
MGLAELKGISLALKVRPVRVLRNVGQKFSLLLITLKNQHHIHFINFLDRQL